MAIRSNMAGSAFGYFQRRAHRKYDELMDDVEDTVREVMTDAETEMKHNISDRGVRDTVPNQDGRGTGKMENAVEHEVTRKDDVIKARVGWLPKRLDRKTAKIYAWQEDGTLNKGEPSGTPKPQGVPPRGIRPMLALRDSEAHAAEALAERLRGRRRRG